MSTPTPSFRRRLATWSPVLARVADDRTTRLLGVGAVIGALAGAAAGALDRAMQAFSVVLLGVSDPSLGGMPWTVALLGPIAGGVLAAVAVRWGTRNARASGIADVIEGVWKQRGHHSLRDGVATALAAVASVGGGQSGGREGPIAQLSASVASKLCRWLDLPADQTRVLVAAGAAAGIAASFNTPIGAAFFALEIVLGNFAMQLFGPVVAATVAGTVVGQALLGDRTALHLPTFTLQHVGELPLYLVLGAGCGLVAVVFKRSMRALNAWVAEQDAPVWVRPIAAGAVVGIIAAAGGQAVMGNGYRFVEQLLSSPDPASLSILVLLIAKLVASVVTSAGAGGAGTFAPTLVVGALTGVVFGTAIQGVPWFPVESPGAYGMVGMGAVAAAVTHAPITITLMLFEMTGNYAIILPLLLAIAVAGLVDAAWGCEAVFHEQLAARGITVDPNQESQVMYDLRVRDLLREDAETVHPETPFAELASRMLRQRMDEVFVVDDDGHFHGLVNVHDIKGLLGTPRDGLTAGDVEVRDVPRLHPSQPIAEAIPLFMRADLDDLPVVDDAGMLLGVLRERDVLGAYSREVLGQDSLLVRFEAGEGDSRQTEFFELPPGTMMGSVIVGPELAHRPLRELDLPRRHHCTVVAAVHMDGQGQSHRVAPDADLTLQVGDRLVVMGPSAEVAALLGRRS